jgi:hypothetical protein
VIEVGGFCEIADGKQRMIYYDRTGSVMRFEECIGRVFEAHGKRNPYKPAAAEKQTPKRQ